LPIHVSLSLDTHPYQIAVSQHDDDGGIKEYEEDKLSSGHDSFIIIQWLIGSYAFLLRCVLPSYHLIMNGMEWMVLSDLRFR
jgi:hypothetical protein